METAAAENSDQEGVSEPGASWENLAPSATQKRTWSFFVFSSNLSNWGSLLKLNMMQGRYHGCRDGACSHQVWRYCACGFRLNLGFLFYGHHKIPQILKPERSCGLQVIFFWEIPPYVWNLPHFLRRVKDYHLHKWMGNRLERWPASLAKLANEKSILKLG